MEWKLFIQALIAVVSAIVTTEFCRWVKSASDDLETLQGSLNFYRAVLIADIVILKTAIESLQNNGAADNEAVKIPLSPWVFQFNATQHLSIFRSIPLWGLALLDIFKSDLGLWTLRLAIRI